MSLAINIDNVIEVLLNDGWHPVASLDNGSSSFDTDAYEYQIRESHFLSFSKDSKETFNGFTFIEEGTNVRISGPMTSILAVKEQSK